MKNFNHYLPNTQKRLLRFKRLIHGKPVAILLLGYSIYELEDRIEELKGLDICFASVNRWLPLEENILSKIDKQCSILMSSADPDLFIEDISSFLDRQDENVYVAERMQFKAQGGENLLRLYENYDDKLLFFTSYYDQALTMPNEDYPLHLIRDNSLSILLALIAIAEPSAIVLFGADGGRISNEGLYYRDVTQAIHPDTLGPEDSLIRDSYWFNQNMLRTLELVRRTHKVRECEIINCSEKTYLTTFPIWSYNETIEYLRRIS